MEHKLLRKKEEIIDWLKCYDVEDYTLVKSKEYGFIVNVGGNVDLNEKDLTHIAVKFNMVNGYFDCANNKLNSLKGAPEIVSGDFNCYKNQLTNLDYCPKEMGESFFCDYNKIISLKGIPSKINGNFGCAYNQLTDLKFAPQIINGYFQSSYNQLKYICHETFPQYVKDTINLVGNTDLQEYQYMDFQELQLILQSKFEKDMLGSSLSTLRKENKILKL